MHNTYYSGFYSVIYAALFIVGHEIAYIAASESKTNIMHTQAQLAT